MYASVNPPKNPMSMFTSDARTNVAIIDSINPAAAGLR